MERKIGAKWTARLVVLTVSLSRESTGSASFWDHVFIKAEKIFRLVDNSGLSCVDMLSDE